MKVGHSRNNYTQNKKINDLLYITILPSLYSLSEGKAWAACTGSTITTPLWKTVGISYKLLGLAGFWAGDNAVYLASLGFLPKANKEKAHYFPCDHISLAHWLDCMFHGRRYRCINLFCLVLLIRIVVRRRMKMMGRDMKQHMKVSNWMKHPMHYWRLDQDRLFYSVPF